MPSDLVTGVWAAQTATLVVAGVLLVYPLLRYDQNVKHPHAVRAMGGAFYLLVIGYSAETILGFPTVGGAFVFAAAAVGALGSWYFARPFVLREGSDVGALPGARRGGAAGHEESPGANGGDDGA